MTDSSSEVPSSRTSRSMWLPWQQLSPSLLFPRALSAGGYAHLLPTWSPLNFCFCLLLVLSLSIHRTGGEGLSALAGCVHPRLPYSILLCNIPQQLLCAHSGGWMRLSDTRAHFPLTSFIHPGPLMLGIYSGVWTSVTSSTPISWAIPLLLPAPASMPQSPILPLPTALSATLGVLL